MSIQSDIRHGKIFYQDFEGFKQYTGRRTVRYIRLFVFETNTRVWVETNGPVNDVYGRLNDVFNAYDEKRLIEKGDMHNG